MDPFAFSEWSLNSIILWGSTWILRSALGLKSQPALLEYEEYKERMVKEKTEWQKHAAAGTIADAQNGVEKIERVLAQVDTKIAEHKDRLTRDQDKMNQLDERRQQILRMEQRQQEKQAKQQQKMLRQQTAVGLLGLI